MHNFHLNESALSDKGELELFKYKRSGMSIDIVFVQNWRPLSQVGWKVFLIP